MGLVTPLPPTGFAVPLRAAFKVFKRWPLLGVASNNLNASLTLYDDRLEYNLLRSNQRRFSEIAMIDARQWMGGHDLIIHWHGAFLATRMNLAQPAMLHGLLQFFSDRGCNLAPAARRLLSAAAAKDAVLRTRSAKELTNG